VGATGTSKSPTVTRIAYFITHPNVAISPDAPVTQWPLSDLGRKRMRICLQQPWVTDLTAVYSSTEQKAIDGAEILSCHLGIRFVCVPQLGENDRSSTGFLPPGEFEAAADQFFAMPEASFRGWERAIDAQRRIVEAIERLLTLEETSGAVAIISHGAVGTLLYCALAGERIDRRWDQPQNGGGNYFRFSLFPHRAHAWWKAIDELEGAHRETV
jgi:broad specificity phosphatase PhoE